MIGKKLFVLILLSLSTYHQSHGCYSDQERKFVQNLSLGEKIGQLFMIGAIATSHEPQKPGEYTEDQIKDGKPYRLEVEMPDGPALFTYHEFVRWAQTMAVLLKPDILLET